MNKRREAPDRRGTRPLGRAVDRRKLLLIGVTVLLCLAALVSVLFVVRRFLKVGDYRIVGMSRYENEELISASGVKKGDLLYALDEEEIEAKILKECPYLDSVTVKAEFPDTLRIEVEGKMPQWYLDVAGSFYTLDNNLTVIAQTSSPEGLTKLVLPNVQSVIYGETPQFGDSDTQRKKTLEVIQAIRKTAFKDRLTLVNLESRWDIRLEVDGCYDVLMGDMTDFDAKLKAIEAIVDRDSVKEAGQGEINIVKGEGGYTAAFSPNRSEK